jgi:hypothetical protein
MAVKIVAGIVAIVLIVGFLLPYVLKMKDAELGIVILIGIGMMLVDLWQSLKERD